MTSKGNAELESPPRVAPQRLWWVEQHAAAGAVGRHPSSETKLKEQRDLHNNAPLTDADVECVS